MIDRSPPKARSGSALVELLVAIPVLFTLLVIAADLGRVLAVKSALTAACRDGARVGTLSSPLALEAANWQANVEAAVTIQLENYYWYSAADLTIAAPTEINYNELTFIKVGMSYEFHPLFELGGLGPTITVTQSATFPVVR